MAARFLWRWVVTATATVWILGILRAEAAEDAKPLGDTDRLRALVEADWTAQEQRRGRTPEQPAAIRDG